MSLIEYLFYGRRIKCQYCNKVERRYYFGIFTGPACSFRHYNRASWKVNIIFWLLLLYPVSLAIYYEGVTTITYPFLLFELLTPFFSIYGYRVHKEESKNEVKKEFKRDEDSDEKFEEWIAKKSSKND